MISVAMCTYNGAKFLPEQLKSIADQTVSGTNCCLRRQIEGRHD